jgi:hypothetical protein
MAGSPGQSELETDGLKRTLSFWDLVLCGIILIQPTAPMPGFRVIYKEAHGGSAFLYVRDEIHATVLPGEAV